MNKTIDPLYPWSFVILPSKKHCSFCTITLQFFLLASAGASSSQQPQQVLLPQQPQQMLLPQQPQRMPLPQQLQQMLLPQQPQQVLLPQQPQQVLLPQQPQQVLLPQQPQQVLEQQRDDCGSTCLIYFRFSSKTCIFICSPFCVNCFYISADFRLFLIEPSVVFSICLFLS